MYNICVYMHIYIIYIYPIYHIFFMHRKTLEGYTLKFKY